MTRFDDIIDHGKVKRVEKKILKLVLEEGDSIIKSIEEGMKENKIMEATVEDINGSVEEATITNMEKGK